MINNCNPINQLKLFGYNNEFNELKKCYENNTFPNRILLYGKRGIGKNTFAYHLINYVLSKDENETYNYLEKEIQKKNRSYDLLLKNIHPNCYIVDLKENKQTIEISQIRNMLSFVNKSSFNNKIRFVLINNAENLNLNSANSLLKVLEDKNENLSFILIHDSKKKILETIKSRCILYNFFLNNIDSNKILNHLIPNLNLSNDFINFYNSPGEIIDLYNFCIDKKIEFENIKIENFLKIICESNILKNNKYINDNIINFFQIYFHKKIFNNVNKNKYFDLHTSFLKKINLYNKYNLDLESILIEFEAVTSHG
tara:strand:+ start:3426 stop:4361 length:936 start_codon:yes stop_codon:yes gene_type:complete